MDTTCNAGGEFKTIVEINTTVKTNIRGERD